jgi:uncharacterized membrane protein YphA (DoxX/SURF4 family)
VSIYVETLIRTPLEAVWTHTQRPELHQRWDLRFTRIEYMPRADLNAPQLFRYATRIGFGLEIDGAGESLGQRDLPDGSSVSALSFGSSDPRSLIREGSGYWKYVPTDAGVRFLTSYDYEPRYGRIGKALDSLLFRPLMGWATAWSFDRLRIWLEQKTEPNVALRHALIHAIARLALAFVFVYQGAVPKLFGRNVDELSMLSSMGVPLNLLGGAVSLVGIAEIILGICLFAVWRSRWPLVVTLVLMTLATLTVSIAAPSFLSAAFNPISLNLAVAAIATIDLLTDPERTPTASRCLRTPPLNKS